MRKSGEVVKPWLIRQKQACEKEFIDSLQLLSDRHEASLQLLRICSEFEDATASVGGRVPGALRTHPTHPGKVRPKARLRRNTRPPMPGDVEVALGDHISADVGCPTTSTQRQSSPTTRLSGQLSRTPSRPTAEAFGHLPKNGLHHELRCRVPHFG